MSFDFETHYKTRLAQIRAEAAAVPAIVGRTVVLLGDSLTEGNPTKFLSGKPVVNQGIGGDQIDHPVGGLIRRADLVGQARPAYLFVLIGINDLNAGKTPAVLKEQYARLLDELARQCPLATIIPQTLLPTRDVFAHLNAGVSEMNEFLQEEGRKRAYDVLDLHALMRDNAGQLRAGFTEDGLHLTDPAYEIWGEALEGVTTRLGGTTRY